MSATLQVGIKKGICMAFGVFDTLCQKYTKLRLYTKDADEIRRKLQQLQESSEREKKEIKKLQEINKDLQEELDAANKYSNELITDLISTQ